MKKIIIVEDDPAILDSLQLVFESTYQVVVFRSADRLMNGQVPGADLFMIDHQLSGTTGSDLCRFLKSGAQTRNVPVILMSASPDIQKIAGVAGAEAYLEKPFSLKILRETVSRLMH
jgi:DNA-binding response OmpR family regulator